MTPEGRVKERVKALLREHGAYWFMPVQNGMGAPSLDFIVCHRGRFAKVETKAGNKGMTPRQEFTAGEVRKAGGTVFLVNESEGMDALGEWLTG